jgi:hypothetical protein
MTKPTRQLMVGALMMTRLAGAARISANTLVTINADLLTDRPGDATRSRIRIALIQVDRAACAGPMVNERRARTLQASPQEHTTASQWAVGRRLPRPIFTGRWPSSDREVIPHARPAEVSLQAARAWCRRTLSVPH